MKPFLVRDSKTSKITVKRADFGSNTSIDFSVDNLNIHKSDESKCVHLQYLYKNKILNLYMSKNDNVNVFTIPVAYCRQYVF